VIEDEQEWEGIEDEERRRLKWRKEGKKRKMTRMEDALLFPPLLLSL